MKPLLIETDRLICRPLRIDDASALYFYRSNPDIYRYQTWQPKNLKDAVHFINNACFVEELNRNQWNQFAICLSDNNKIIGDCGALLSEKNAAEIGFTIARPYQNKGYAREAVSGILSYLFKSIGIARVKACIDPENEASIKLIRKLGFVEDANPESTVMNHSDLHFIMKKHI